MNMIDDVLWHEYGHFIAQVSKTIARGYHYLSSNDMDFGFPGGGWGISFHRVKTCSVLHAGSALDVPMMQFVYVDTWGGSARS